MLSPKELAELLCVSTHSLKKWRYLPEKDPRYLPAFAIEGGNPQHLFYDTETILKWANRHRNAKFLDRVIAALAPPETYRSVLPAARSQQQVAQLRNQEPSTAGLGLLAGAQTP